MLFHPAKVPLQVISFLFKIHSACCDLPTLKDEISVPVRLLISEIFSCRNFLISDGTDLVSSKANKGLDARALKAHDILEFC